MTKQAFFYREEGRFLKMDLAEIVYIEAASNYAKFHKVNKKYLIVRTSLDTALNQLPENQFIRIHRSFAVSADYLDEIGRTHVTINKLKLLLPISRKYYLEFTKQYVIGSALPESPE